MQKNEVVYRIPVDGETVIITMEMVNATEPQIMQEYLRMLWRQEHQERREYRCRDIHGVRCTGSCSECSESCNGKPVSLEALTEAGMAFADQYSVEESVSRKLLIEALRVALATLQTVDREIIELIYFRGLSERETAARLGLSQKSVNRHKRQALKLLRELLADYQ